MREKPVINVSFWNVLYPFEVQEQVSTDFKDSRQRVQEEEEKLPLELEGERGKKEPSESRRLLRFCFHHLHQQLSVCKRNSKQYPVLDRNWPVTKLLLQAPRKITATTKKRST
jgi:hypothetical protein